MKPLISGFLWLLVGAMGLWAYATVAVHRGEQINSAYLLVAALCTYAIGYRFYSKWIAARVLALNDRRATPCEVHDDGRDFVKTNKWIVFGHHFAAISGPGPLVGPVLAAQFGYLPGTLWILIGVVLGGAVQDFVILFASIRRDGRSLGRMVRDELNSTAGVVGTVAILAIMIILLAVLALVVVNALAESPWGVFTVGATIPIALFMGLSLRYWRVGRVVEVSIWGILLLLLAVWGGQFVHTHPRWHEALLLRAEPLAWAVIAYGFAASVLPVWLLLAPRDYLSTFMKLGTIAALALGVLLVLPELRMPALTRYIDGSGLVVPGKLFPFCFITIACGAISGFHSLISSGITPKIITRESYARPIGYGAMCLESLVAIMAMIAACTLDPGVYLGMNVRAPGANPGAIAEATRQRVESSGFTVLRADPAEPGAVREVPVTLSIDEMNRLAEQVGETSLFGRTGGAATLAVGMANIFSEVTRGRWLDLWYHFAIMFEALFILTTLDAGTRVGRYLLQDALGRLWKPMGDTSRLGPTLASSLLIVAGWGLFLILGVRDPEGGVKALWPIFGIANQLLASIALCLATTILLKMQLRPPPAPRGRPALALVTLVPLLWLLAVTVTAGLQKIAHPDPRIGFLAASRTLAEARPGLQQKLEAARTEGNTAGTEAALRALRANRVQQLNNRIDTAVTAAFLLLVGLIVTLSVREWILLLARKKLAELHETEPAWLPEFAVAEARPFHFFSLVALSLALLREVAGEAAVDRTARHAAFCAATPRRVELLGGRAGRERRERGMAYVETARARYEKNPRCC